MSEWVGYPDAKVILKKKGQQYVTPSQTKFDINIGQLELGLGGLNFRTNNIYHEKAVGAVTIQPLFMNRSNYMAGLAVPDNNELAVNVPMGAPPETVQELSKRVFVALPTINQTSLTSVSKPRQQFIQPAIGKYWSGSSKYDGPIWANAPQSDVGFDITPEENTEEEENLREKLKFTNWITQNHSANNVEWFLLQHNPLFTNQSFWIDVKKNKKIVANVDDPEETHRFYRYRTSEPIDAYFAIRIGADKYTDVSYPGGLDIVFPVDGFPFIYDHEGDEVRPSQSRQSLSDYFFNGYIADVNTQQNWILKNDIESFRIWVFIIRGKMVIRSSFAGEDNFWVFPGNINERANSETIERYDNFFVKSSRAIIMGRGFSFNFNFNPLEFNIYDQRTGQERRPHALMTSGTLSCRLKYPDGTVGSWRDIEGTPMEGEEDEDGNFKFANFTLVPFDRSRDTDNESNRKSFGFDYVTEEYEGHSGHYTSMMMAVNPNDTRDIIKTTMRDPRPGEDVEWETGPLFESVQLDVGAGRRMFVNKILDIEFNSVGPNYASPNGLPRVGQEGISKRFTSPVLWRMKGEQRVGTPISVESLDITNFVKSIDYSTSAEDFHSVQQTYTVNIQIPKDWQFEEGRPYANFSSSGLTREEILDWIINGVREIEIYLGWWGDGRYRDGALIDPPRGVLADDGTTVSDIFVKSATNKIGSEIVKVFTGLTSGCSLTETYALDSISLRCVEKTQVLEDGIIFNSPYFDSMALDRAFYDLGTVGGAPRSLFRIRSNSASRRILPGGFNFLEPKMRFKRNTKIWEGMKQIAAVFFHVLRTEPDGKIVLTDLYDSPDGRFFDSVEDIPITHRGFVYYVNGFVDQNGNVWEGEGESGAAVNDNQNPFQRCYETLESDKRTTEHHTQLYVQTIDRRTGEYIFDASHKDVDSIENPNVPNFIGYEKPFLYRQPAFGTEEALFEFEKEATARLFTSPLKVNITSYGRPTLRPFDIIEVIHQDPKTITRRDCERSIHTTKYNIKYRVMAISGTISYEDQGWLWKMNIEGQHI